MYGRKHTEESKKKMSNAKKGKPSTWLGKHHTEEAKRKLSLANKGKKLTAAQKQKRKATMSRPEVRAKLSSSISKAHKGSFWVTDGKTNHFMNRGSAIPEGFHAGRTIESKSTTGYHWYNDGKKSILVRTCPAGFVHGRLKI